MSKKTNRVIEQNESLVARRKKSLNGFNIQITILETYHDKIAQQA